MSLGRFDLVGDVHGTICTLDAMLERLGYLCAGGCWYHPEGRVLISVGDLIDRGPDPLGCVERIAALVDSGCAHMVLGNHELNALHYVEGLREHSDKNRAQFQTTLTQIDASPQRWDRARAFIESQPTHLLLDEGRLRVVHAYWDPDAIRQLPTRVDTRELLVASGPGGRLEHAFELCIKGPERAVPRYRDHGGHWRETQRVAWWNEYPADAPKLVFGHYWFPWPEHTPTSPGWTGPGANAACLDFRAGRGGPLVALRYPEGEFVSVPNLDM
ncbi:serine/threonine protein phosphatase [Enhygromyxa salina]|uniref:Serine/threonine protein phosphatase n=1 Tax=Enhygromyxa salina TaxID=215803 RepID=A0A0C1ZCX4_9BACT|nr:metallophosphoesterase [Enhygromyxa salina]KIG15554.1 serine/threonine protein phosphatase [Enhygromyxa salina]